MPEWGDLRRDRAAGGQRIQHCSSLGRLAKLEHHERVLQMPVAQRADVVGRWRHSAEHCQRFGGAFLQQHVGDEVEPRAGVVRFAVDGVAQQGFGRLQLSGDAQEAAQVGDGGGMIRLNAQRLAHRGLGLLDGALPIAGDALVLLRHSICSTDH
jgi:hypothetical protein